MTDNTILAAEVVSAFVAHNSVPAGELPNLIKAVFSAFEKLSVVEGVVEPQPRSEPAVSIRKSVHPDYLISLEDGRKYQTLKRHLSVLGMTPDEYRAKWGLAADYPMTSAAYSAKRSQLARSLGLGRKPAELVEVPQKPKRVRGKVSDATEVEVLVEPTEIAQEAA